MDFFRTNYMVGADYFAPLLVNILIHGQKMSIDGIGAAKPFGEGLFLFEQVPTEETAICVGLYDDGTLLQSAVGQEDVMIGTLHFLSLLIRCGIPRCG